MTTVNPHDYNRNTNFNRYSVGIHFNGADSILHAYAEKQREAQAELEKAGDRVGDGAGEDVAMVLVDLKTVIKGMRAVALQIANPIDQFLKSIADEYVPF